MMPSAQLEIARTREPAGSASLIRVCFLIDYLGTGGSERQLLALIRHLDRSKVEPFLVLLDGETADSRALEPVDCPVMRLGVRSLCRWSTLRAARRFARFLHRERIDILQTYFADSTYFGVPVARLAGVRRVVRTRLNLGYWMTPLHRWLGRLCTGLADATVANCEACRAADVRDEWAKPETVAVVENGVELSRFVVTPEAFADRRPNAPRSVGLVANLRPIKDPETFVRAAAIIAGRFPNVTFRVAGEGEMRPKLEHVIAELGLSDRIALLGKVEDVAAFLGTIDIGVLCSFSEGSSNAVLEYMAAGRAIAATAVGGTPQLLEDGVHGLLIPAGAPKELAAAIERLLDAPAWAAQLGAAARHRVQQCYEGQVRAKRFEEFYRRLLD
jgi:glycosyltransferase involved in cell wall biosynthesis